MKSLKIGSMTFSHLLTCRRHQADLALLVCLEHISFLWRWALSSLSIWWSPWTFWRRTISLVASNVEWLETWTCDKRISGTRSRNAEAVITLTLSLLWVLTLRRRSFWILCVAPLVWELQGKHLRTRPSKDACKWVHVFFWNKSRLVANEILEWHRFFSSIQHTSDSPHVLPT